MGYIAALDIGIASVGWAVIDKDSETVVASGANLFPEATSANNLTRRQMRQAKRGKRRERTRLDDFEKLWAGFDFPVGNSTEIVQLKVKGLSEKLTLEEIHAVLYSYLKHRGISYLEDAQDDNISAGNAYSMGLALNQKELTLKNPCEIQLERLEKYGQYRGQNSYETSDNELITISNVFTVSAYRNEIKKLFQTQKVFHKEITEEFIDDYLAIFNRKRKYYEGPGNEKSRSDYGIYTTKIDSETGEYITEKNIFEKLIGKCSVYPEEFRAAAASYTAQEFNLLNDLNNLVVNGRKLEEEEKHKIVETVKISDTVNMKKIIEKTIKEKISILNGARIDKNDKEIFHSFEAYNKLRKELRTQNIDIASYTREELDIIGHILTINTDKESILEAFSNSTLALDSKIIDCFIAVRKKNSALFSKWHSFSLKIMNELIPEMYAQPKEQMTLLTEMGIFKSNVEQYAGLKYLPVDVVCEELLNPVVRRAVRISIKVLNGLLKEYKVFDEIVIEMPRDRNSDEEKKRIADGQKRNENEINEIEKLLAVSYERKITPRDYSLQKNLTLKLKLWKEQEGICLYSGKTIDPRDILDHPDLFEIDHIIPRSISFDDSRANKVLVYRTENQKKGNNTPYYYLTHTGGVQTFDEYKNRVLQLAKKKGSGITRKKVQNLLFDKDITKIEVLQGFISRNINDTRYASKVVLNTVQGFFRAQRVDTKVKVIRGAYTHQMRVNMKLDKNREESYSHHAVDAMLIAYSQLGYEAYRQLQGGFINFETGEILDQEMWNEKMSDDVYQKYLYGIKWSNIRRNITEAEKKVKYWYYVDKKSNRGLCNQTIRGTREYDGKIYKINKVDIRSKEGVAVFKKLAFDKKQRNRFLIYKNDRQTFDNLIQIFNDYKDAKNPFLQYEKETGDLVRKFSKKHNGPKIVCLKYTDGEVGACIDISHKYGFEKNSKKVILESLVPYRTDVYFKPDNGLYYLVGVKQSDVKCENGRYKIDEEAYASILLNEKMIEKGMNRKDLERLGFVFKMSFYKNEIIYYEKNDRYYTERFLSRTMPKDRNYIETKPLDHAKFNKRNLIGLSKTKMIKKIRVDILGNRYMSDTEEFSVYC